MDPLGNAFASPFGRDLPSYDIIIVTSKSVYQNTIVLSSPVLIRYKCNSFINFNPCYAYHPAPGGFKNTLEKRLNLGRKNSKYPLWTVNTFEVTRKKRNVLADINSKSRSRSVDKSEIRSLNEILEKIQLPPVHPKN